MSNTILTYPLQGTPLGKPWEEWIKLWWEWCYGDQLSTSPLSDITGELCGKGQIHDRVWFLAGTFGGYAERRCEIPFGKSMFFPVLNDIVSFATDPQLKTEMELASYAKADLDNAKILRVIIDGYELIDVKDYRVRTAAFDISLPLRGSDNKYMTTRAVSDGYWMFLRPLGKGCHSIYFVGEKIEFDKAFPPFNLVSGMPSFRVEVKYKITIG
jgi:hypothetical protein